MVDISQGVKETLDLYIERYVDSRNGGDYCVSQFWRWYYQLRNHIYKLDRLEPIIGTNLVYNMDYWGNIHYSREIIGSETFVLINEIEINTTNFSNWIRYSTLPPITKKADPSTRVISWESDGTPSYNGIYKVISNNGLYSLADKGNNLLIDYWFKDLDFPHIEDNYEGYSIIGLGKSYADIQYLIQPNLKIIHPAAVAIKNRRIINNAVSRAINNLINEIIEEDRQRRIQRIVRETIERFINNLVA